MARPRKERPNFVSVDIFRLRQIASGMDNENFGSWCRKALDDMSIGCIGEGVDEEVRECYEHALTRMREEQEANRKKYESRKSSQSSEIVPVNGSKRNDQLIWGRFKNVYLSQEEYNTLLNDFGNINLLNQVIDSLSASIEDGNTKSQNHFATLTRWIAWRKSQAEKDNNSNHYESVSEYNRRVREQSDREIEMLAEKGYLR